MKKILKALSFYKKALSFYEKASKSFELPAKLLKTSNLNLFKRFLLKDSKSFIIIHQNSTLHNLQIFPLSHYDIIYQQHL